MAKPLLIYDDSCPFCRGLWGILTALDSDHKIDYLGRNTESGRKKREKLNLELGDSDTIILATGPKHYIKSDALFHSLRIIGGFWKVFSYFRFAPRFIRDGIYDLIAKNRHILTGKPSSQCPIRHDSRK